MNLYDIDKLKRDKGLCIVYTHFASDFVEWYKILDKIITAENIQLESKVKDFIWGIRYISAD